MDIQLELPVRRGRDRWYLVVDRIWLEVNRTAHAALM